MIGLTPSQKGAAAEAAITSAVIQLGLTVLRPLCEGRRYDVIVDLEPSLLRVQCKLARRTGGVLAINLQTSRYTPNGYVRGSYSATEIDAFGTYSPELGACYLLPIGLVAGRRSLHLRLEPTGNNQADGINWARDYELEPVLERLRADQPRESLIVGSYTFSTCSQGL
jgi:PD-(D/E)XK nuclease superfamily protein